MSQLIDILQVISSFWTHVLSSYRLELGQPTFEWVGRALIIGTGIILLLGGIKESNSLGEGLLIASLITMLFTIAILLAFTSSTSIYTSAYLGIGLWCYAYAMIVTAIDILGKGKLSLSILLGLVLPIAGFIAPKIELGMLMNILLIAVDIVIITYAILLLLIGFRKEEPIDRVFLTFFFGMFGFVVSVAVHSNLTELALKSIKHRASEQFSIRLTKWLLISGNTVALLSRWIFTIIALILLTVMLMDKYRKVRGIWISRANEESKGRKNHLSD